MQFTNADQPQAVLIGKEFIDIDQVCLVLGDNDLFGQGLPGQLRETAGLENGGLIFAYHVRDPRRHRVVELDSSGRPVGLEEKPVTPRSEHAVQVIDVLMRFRCRNLGSITAAVSEKRTGNHRPRPRIYPERGKLQARLLGRGVAWLDTGTPEALLQASSFVRTVQERQRLMISCPEEIAYRTGFITLEQLTAQAKPLPEGSYRAGLETLVRELAGGCS
jgi:glucose-1-phosphate thymidylyltransferase